MKSVALRLNTVCLTSALLAPWALSFAMLSEERARQLKMDEVRAWGAGPADSVHLQLIPQQP